MAIRTVIRTYYRLTKPGIVYGNALAAIGGYWYGSESGFAWERFVVMLLGLGLVIASACVWNNYIDRAIDARMRRTQKRALVQGAVSEQRAIVFAAGLGLLGFGLLSILNVLSILVAFVGYVFYIVVYGIAKRTTIHGTLVGSISGATPPVVGYVAATGVLNTGAVLLFLALVTWQMPHFYAIALNRIRDYAAAGIPVLPRVHGAGATRLQMVFYTLMFIGVMFSFTLLDGASWSFLTVMTVCGLWWLRQSVSPMFTKDTQAWSRQNFRYSLIVLLVFSGMLVADRWLP